MRFITQIERNAVKDFIQKDKTITCPRKGDYYAMIDMDKNEILTALCIVDAGTYYHVQSMRTAKENRRKGYSTRLLEEVVNDKRYSDKPICADCLIYSKNIFARVGFMQVKEFTKGNHKEWSMRREAVNGKAKN